MYNGIDSNMLLGSGQYITIPMGHSVSPWPIRMLRVIHCQMTPEECGGN